MRFHLLALLALTACAAPSTGTTYRQGAFVPMEAPPFEATETAPHTTGQPGHVAPEEVPRSPDARRLPQTPQTRREAGVWASGDGHSRDSRIAVLGVMLPLGPGGDDELTAPLGCMMRINDALDHAGRGDAEALPPNEKACLVAMLYRRCTQLALDRDERAKKAGTDFDVAHSAATFRAAVHAARFHHEKCQDPSHAGAARVFPVIDRFLTKAMP
jgi:hypothetical protein